MWERLCSLRRPIDGNCLEHFAHGNIAPIPCLQLCILRPDASTKYWSHGLQWCFFFPTCSTLIWLFKDCAPTNPLWQMLHVRLSLVTFSRTVVALLNFATLHACIADKEAWKSWARWASARYLNISSSSLGFKGSGTSFHSRCNTNPTSKSSSSCIRRDLPLLYCTSVIFQEVLPHEEDCMTPKNRRCPYPWFIQQKRHKHTHKGY